MNGAPFLLIDAGNSRVKWALADANGVQTHSGTFTHGGLLVKGVGDPLVAEHEPDWDALPAPRAAWVSNVAGEAVARRIDTLLDAYWPALPRTTIRATAWQCGVRNGYTVPESLGSDRWAGMIGARAAFPDEDVLIATFGTATTLEALRKDGTFEGGLIAPGWSLMMRSLGEHTAQLPTLGTLDAQDPLTDDHPRDAAHVRPAATDPHALCFATNTRDAIAAGCALAQAAFIERMWRRLQDEWGTPVRLVVGGGAAGEVAGSLQAPYTRHDSLVLAGLALIAADDVGAHVA
ncbi:type III pantothenate kinase [Paraburkholderia rhizosphaerae]|uniref:Type III pantothenate kinase n=1 Tax=Paraburkholderia rhizosphaerae TaxID=480658 RepID=A0A4R8M213_9BURK|nr:type III pantothenate kinase [Paraburkholderia rhizosphaerae]TDY53541.1 type III pantothenate kinase [Paraburkholderia rhizosphaerae]